MLDFTALNAELARDTDLTSSIDTMVDRLLAEIEANKTNPAALQAVVDKFRENNDKTVASVLKGTIADPAA
jgi:hypothetical protein